jgi:hypothetical protein
MVPADLVILNEADNALPDLADTEMALVAAPVLPPPASRLREYLIRDLEHGPAA